MAHRCKRSCSSMTFPLPPFAHSALRVMLVTCGPLQTESGSGSSSSERRPSRSESLGKPSLPQPHSAAVPDAPPGRVYHNIWRNAHIGSSNSLPSLRDLAQTLIERGNGGASSSMAREVGRISSLSELADPLTSELQRPASYRCAQRDRASCHAQSNARRNCIHAHAALS